MLTTLPGRYMNHRSCRIISEKAKKPVARHSKRGREVFSNPEEDLVDHVGETCYRRRSLTSADRKNIFSTSRPDPAQGSVGVVQIVERQNPHEPLSLQKKTGSKPVGRGKKERLKKNLKYPRTGA